MLYTEQLSVGGAASQQFDAAAGSQESRTEVYQVAGVRIPPSTGTLQRGKAQEIAKNCRE
jgi:hypothetical protein